MSSRGKYRLIGTVLAIVTIHSVLLFVIIPSVSARLGPMYNQERYADGYDQLAANLEAGNGYRFYPDTARTLMREPGYPIMLAGLQMTFGKSFTVVKLANMAMALITAWGMVLIAGKVWPDAMANRSVMILVPSLLYLLDPGVLIAESRGGVENLFALLVTAFLLTVYKAIQSQRWRDFVVSGLILGLTLYVRSTPMLFPLCLLGYLAITQRRRISPTVMLKNIAAMTVTMLVVLSPWIYRNYVLVGKFVPTASVLGVSAQAGQYIGEHISDGKPWYLLDREASRERDKVAIELGYPFEDGASGYYQTFYRSGDELRFSDYLLRKVIAGYRESPLLFVKCVTRNVFNFWFAGKTSMATFGNIVVQLPYLAFALIGAVYSIRKREARIVGPMVLLIGYIMAVHLPILAQARYSVPLFPMVCLMAAMGLMATRKRLMERFVGGTDVESGRVDMAEARESHARVG